MKSYAPVNGRNISALLNPRPVLLIGVQKNDMMDMTTAAWSTPVSHNPPMLCVSLKPSSVALQTLKDEGKCIISILGAQHVALAAYWGSHSGLESFDSHAGSCISFKEFQEELKDMQTQDMSPAESFYSLPVVADASSILLCSLNQVMAAGDHELVLLDVRLALSKEQIRANGNIEPTDTLLCIQHDLFAAEPRIIA
ncbi:MAG: flavin reductase family protein [Eggerthellaceae bacterium]|nr:flavin reductase family protein [Eggerthellaceae bacterium]